VSEFLAKEVSECLDDAVKEQFRGVASILEQPVVQAFTVESGSRLTSDSYQALHDLLAKLEGVRSPISTWRPSHTGMIFAGPAVDGSISWVSEAAVQRFIQEGKKSLKI
jgi:hypothetical protein